MTAVLRSPGVAMSGTRLQAVPLPNGPVHTLDTSAGEAATAAFDDRTKAFALTLTDSHWIRTDGDPATAGAAGEFKIPAGFTFWPRGHEDVGVSLFPEGGAASSGDGIQCVGEYR